MSTYNFNKLVDAGRLEFEIQASTISIAIKRILVNGANVSITFKVALSPAEEAVLNTIVNNHTGEPLETEEIATVRLYEGASGTGSNYRVNGRKFEIPAGVAGDEVAIDWSWPIPLRLFTASWVERAEHYGAKVNFEIAPDTVVGQLTGALAVGGVWVDVPAATIPNVERGYHLCVAAADMSSNEDLGTIVDIDYDNSRIKVNNPAQVLWPAGSLLLMTIRMAKDLYLSGDNVARKIGGGKIGGSLIPAGTVLRFRYERPADNSTPVLLMVQFELDY